MRRVSRTTLISDILREELYCRLNAALSSMRLKDLSTMLNIDITVLSKYIHRHIKPSLARTRELLSRLRSIDYKQPLVNCLLKNIYVFPEANNILYGCSQLFHCVIFEALDYVKDLDFDTIFTLEGGGLAVASIIQHYTNTKLIYGLRDVIVGGGHSILYKYTPLYAWGPRIKRYITYPSKSRLRRGSAIIVDDIAWTGGTVLTIYDYVSKRFSVKGVFLIATFEDVLSKIREKIRVNVKTIISFPSAIRDEVLKKYFSI